MSSRAGNALARLPYRNSAARVTVLRFIFLP